MIIGIDLDNTISDLPAFFAVLAEALMRAGHEVHVLTYREAGTEDSVKKELDDLGIRYTGLHIPSGPCQAPTWKARVAERLGLELMIEDSPEVLAAMPSSVKRLWLCDPEVFDLDRCLRALRDGG